MLHIDSFDTLTGRIKVTRVGHLFDLDVQNLQGETILTHSVDFATLVQLRDDADAALATR